MKKVTLMLSLFVLCATAYAQDALTEELFSADNIMKYRAEIDLSDEQAEQIKKHYNEGTKFFNEAKWKLSAEKSKLDKMLTRPKVALDTTMKQMWDVTALEQEAKLARLFALIKMKNELTAQQQSKLKGLITDKDRRATSITTGLNDEKKVKVQVSGAKRTSPATPLYILKTKNGDREVTEAQLQNLDDEDIESILVVKGKTATKAYGKKAKNGVIEITLKDKN